MALVCTPPNTCFSNGISLSHFCTAHSKVSLYCTMGRSFPPLKIPPSHTWISTPSNTWFPGPTRVLNPTASRLVETFLQGSLLWQTDWLTDRPTDHATRLVTKGHICGLTTAAIWRPSSRERQADATSHGPRLPSPLPSAEELWSYSHHQWTPSSDLLSHTNALNNIHLLHNSLRLLLAELTQPAVTPENEARRAAAAAGAVSNVHHLFTSMLRINTVRRVTVLFNIFYYCCHNSLGLTNGTSPVKIMVQQPSRSLVDL